MDTGGECPILPSSGPRLDGLDCEDPAPIETRDLGAAAYRARLVEEGTDHSTARKDERPQRLEILLAVVHSSLESAHVVGTDRKHPVVVCSRWRRELAP